LDGERYQPLAAQTSDDLREDPLDPDDVEGGAELPDRTDQRI
jgi:hypothetical protein